jgi:V-type H+-transporting ATPase subunit H
VNLLKESEDTTVLAVAAHDIGQYVKHYERGKKSVALLYNRMCHLYFFWRCRIVTDLGAKTRVMELMTHQDSDVRYRALLSVQQLVSQPWVAV